ncbi:MAG: DUF1697 domain-containing protein [Pseudomonadota bacterium]
MKRWAALLKGVNVGGNRRLPMADLKAFLKGLGFANVRTLLASGNAVFDCDEADAAALEALLEHAATERLGLTTDWLLRDAAGIDATIAANPFAAEAVERPNRLLLVFTRESLPADLPERLAAIHRGPERVAVAGRTLYIDYVDADTMRDSKLPQAMAKLGAGKGAATGRNWNTVIKLRQMLD